MILPILDDDGSCKEEANGDDDKERVASNDEAAAAAVGKDGWMDTILISYHDPMIVDWRLKMTIYSILDDDPSLSKFKDGLRIL